MGLLDPGDARIPSRLLNDVNDPGPGTALLSPSGSVVQPYYGMVGKRLVLNAQMALDMSDTAIGTLYEGIYQYVQINPASVTAPARGKIVYWNNAIGGYENFSVITDTAAATAATIAGVLLSAPTIGNYCYIQLAGKTSVQFKTALTKVAVAGDMVYADTATPTADVILDATSVLSPQLKLMLGVALAAPANNTISLVDVWHIRQTIGGLRGF